MLWVTVTSLSSLSSLLLDSLVLGRAWRDKEVMLEQLVSQETEWWEKRYPEKHWSPHLQSVLAQSPGSGHVTPRPWLPGLKPGTRASPRTAVKIREKMLGAGN